MNVLLNKKNIVLIKAVWGFSLLVLAQTAFALVSLEGEYVPPAERAKQEAEAAAKSLSDGKAIVDEVEGKAYLTQSGNPIQVRLKEGDAVEAGDSIYTEKGASLTLSFDDEKLNVIKIPAENKAVFVSIEPTDIRLEDGSIFSAVDGLEEGMSWKVSTPAAVVAVRGTTFEVSYSASTGDFDTATFEDEKTDKTSAVEIQSLQGGETVRVGEGKQLSFARGQAPRIDLVRAVAPERATRGLKMREKVNVRREENRQIREERRKKLDDAAAQGNPPNGPGGADQPGEKGGSEKNPKNFEPRHVRDGVSPSGHVPREGFPAQADSDAQAQQKDINPNSDLQPRGEGPSGFIRRRPIPEKQKVDSVQPSVIQANTGLKEMPQKPIHKQPFTPPAGAQSAQSVMAQPQKREGVKTNGVVNQKGPPKPPARPAAKSAQPAKRVN